MFIVADQFTVGVSGEGGFACAGESEEYGCGAGLRVHIAGAVHRQHVFFDRHRVVHNREDGFFDLPRILGTSDDGEVGLVVDDDCRFRVDAVAFRVDFVAWRDEDGVVRFAESVQFFCGWSDQQVADEEILRRQFVDDAELAAVLRVRPCKTIKHIHFMSAEETDHLPLDGVEDVPSNRAVYIAPVDSVVHAVRIHDVLVVR